MQLFIWMRARKPSMAVRLGMGYAFNRSFAFEGAVSFISLGSADAIRETAHSIVLRPHCHEYRTRFDRGSFGG